MASKSDLRRLIREKKKLISPDLAVAESISVMNKIEQTPEFRQASRILLYNALPDELPTQQWIERWFGTKTLFLPRVNGDVLDVLDILEITDFNFVKSEDFGILEPKGDDLVDISTIQLVIVPGVAFDPQKHRLGRGKGFYDKLLSEHSNIPTIGVAFDFQILESIPADPHDIPMHKIITHSHTF